MGGLKLLHSTAKTGKRQMQTDGGINRWHMWRAHKPFLNSISSTSWTFGESSGFLVIRYRSAGARLWKTHKGTHSLSPFHTLHSLRGITQTSWDLIKKKKEEKNSIKRLLCEDTAGRRTEGMMREKEETWKRHQDFSEDKKKGGKKSMFHFSPLFGFIFPMWPCTTGEGEEKQNTARKSGKGHENEITHILKNSVYLTSEKTIKPHWCYDSTDLSSSSARLRESADSIVFLPFSHSSLIFQFSTCDFLSDISPSALFSNEESSPKWASHNKTFKSTP